VNKIYLKPQQTYSKVVPYDEEYIRKEKYYCRWELNLYYNCLDTVYRDYARDLLFKAQNRYLNKYYQELEKCQKINRVVGQGDLPLEPTKEIHRSRRREDL
jgi:hypothetical protein